MLGTLLKGPFEAAGCSFERDGWITTDLTRGQHVKWVPAVKQTFRFDVIESKWVPSAETRNEFLALARQYSQTLRSRR